MHTPDNSTSHPLGHSRRHWAITLALGWTAARAQKPSQAPQPTALAVPLGRPPNLELLDRPEPGVAKPAAVPAAAGKDSVQLAVAWPAGRSPEGFLVSEKFDGVRAVWDGRHLRFRSGRPLSAPAWFTQALPPEPLDGELWWGRGQFDSLSAAVRPLKPRDEAWLKVQYLLFDAPGHAGAFEQRVAHLQRVVSERALPWLQTVAQSRLADTSALNARLQEVLAQGGEGLVLHRAQAWWAAGPSGALFKLKPEPDDEARVVGHQPGQGRLAGQTGALLLETAQGRHFALGSGLSDAVRQNPPPVGAWVTYRYQSLTPAGLPRFARFLRLREPE